MVTRVAYLVNQYPSVSHTFIRTEIAALERHGAAVHRFSLRSARSPSADPADRNEALRTEVFEDSPSALLRSTLSRAAKRPRDFARAVALGARIGWRSPRGVSRHGGYLAAAAHLAERCEALGITHVHAHFGTNPAAVARLARALGGPAYSFTVHGPEEFDDVWALSLEEKVAAARFVVAISDFGRSQLYRHLERAHWPKVRVVRCSVGERFVEARPTPPPAVRRVVTVGRLSAQKGHALLVEAAAELASRGRPFELVFVGDGELRPELEAMIARRGLERLVRITGWADGAEVRRWIERSRALVLPSFGEGLPVVLMEALALCRPVLSTSIAGIPELVEANECGHLVPAGSVDALVEGLAFILEAPSESLAAMGAEGRRRVLSRHHPDANARTLLSLFKEREDDRRVPTSLEESTPPSAAPRAIEWMEGR